MLGDLVIGIDSSTTATKAIALDRDGRIVAEGRPPCRCPTPSPAGSSRKWTTGPAPLTKALKQLTKKVDASRIAAIAISNQRESFAQFDAKGKALRPGTLWLDERAHQEVKDIAAEIGRRHSPHLRQARRRDALPLSLPLALHPHAEGLGEDRDDRGSPRRA